jgi:hypothetical protein
MEGVVSTSINRRTRREGLIYSTEYSPPLQLNIGP